MVAADKSFSPILATKMEQIGDPDFFGVGKPFDQDGNCTSNPLIGQ